MPDIPTTVTDLINRFKQNIDVYKKSYNETMLRKEFIDPFFEALGWDVSNKSGYAEAYKDVIHEAAVKVGGKTKAPDYAFRIGGIKKFFLEAKKPAVDIKENIHPAYQLRRYAWSAKLPLSILTDFEITWRDDVFKDAPQSSSAANFGTLGINFKARKA